MSKDFRFFSGAFGYVEGDDEIEIYWMERPDAPYIWVNSTWGDPDKWYLEGRANRKKEDLYQTNAVKAECKSQPHWIRKSAVEIEVLCRTGDSLLVKGAWLESEARGQPSRHEFAGSLTLQSQESAKSFLHERP